MTAEETDILRSQIVTLKRGRGQHLKYAPYAFTEHGAIMVAVEMSTYVVRAFLRMRELLSSDKELARRFAQVETRVDQADEIHGFGLASGGRPFAARARSMRRRTNSRRRSIAGLPNPRAWMASSRSRALGPA